MKSLTEAEIQSLTRKYLARNKFQFLSRTCSGESLHYRLEMAGRPKFKVPDVVAVSGSCVLVFEEKVRYSDLFAEGSSGLSDIRKLTTFLSNEQAVIEFRKLLLQTRIPPNNPTIIGAVGSLKAMRASSNTIPRDLVFISVQIVHDGFLIELCQDGGIGNLFQVKKERFDLQGPTTSFISEKTAELL